VRFHSAGRCRTRLWALALAVSALVLAACGSSSSSNSSSTSAPTSSTTPTTSTSTPTTTSSTASAATTQISVRTVSGLGRVLVDARGHTLYMFEPDKRAKVTCVGACASVWPPVKLSDGQKAAAVGGAKSSLLASDPDPEGGQVVTYAGWPLYTYVADSGPGTATGQGLNVNGGLWYVLSPSGKVITKKP
jgi:predicted lipoprotein with Yx(FWY)xxD motif